MRRRTIVVILLAVALVSFACRAGTTRRAHAQDKPGPAPQLKLSPTVEKVIDAAHAQVGVTLTYDPAYSAIPYPNGDVPREKGVCTDVVVRAFRDGASVDLQKEVHEDMKRNFAVYPKKWGLKKPDANIDHRRVPNLMTYFARQKKSLPVTDNPADYQPGDVVAWDLGGGVPHIGLMSSQWNADTGRYSITHNIGWGATTEDRLFEWKIIGHYRYF
jgi:uncharacterized protein YijF (DUF1287 family)